MFFGEGAGKDKRRGTRAGGAERCRGRHGKRLLVHSGWDPGGHRRRRLARFSEEPRLARFSEKPLLGRKDPEDCWERGRPRRHREREEGKPGGEMAGMGENEPSGGEQVGRSV